MPLPRRLPVLCFPSEQSPPQASSAPRGSPSRQRAMTPSTAWCRAASSAGLWRRTERSCMERHDGGRHLDQLSSLPDFPSHSAIEVPPLSEHPDNWPSWIGRAADLIGRPRVGPTRIRRGAHTDDPAHTGYSGARATCEP
ncbi:hypothetical protein Taro_049863 [Colocasia esculenta]|uniref:Uncharacterized protein n=1 Tax=Colocasia esculenta TaxID=4460 RepID=A0A843XC84_COLES|nr:hypothetical protein [Colocasia esculenta]